MLKVLCLISNQYTVETISCGSNMSILVSDSMPNKMKKNCFFVMLVSWKPKKKNEKGNVAYNCKHSMLMNG